MAAQYARFRDFYPYYLSEHSNPTCRRLHFLGSTLALVFFVTAIATRNAWWVLAALFAAYGCAWIGHFVFEKNRPATFTYPFYSFAGDWVMYVDMLRGKVRF